MKLDLKATELNSTFAEVLISVLQPDTKEISTFKVRAVVSGTTGKPYVALMPHEPPTGDWIVEADGKYVGYKL